MLDFIVAAHSSMIAYVESKNFIKSSILSIRKGNNDFAFDYTLLLKGS